MLYKIKTIEPEGSSMKTKKTKAKQREVVLNDLLKVIPTLKKHSLEAEIVSHVRKLRSGRKVKRYSIELSRNYKGEEIKVASEELKKDTDRFAIIRDLKTKICEQIRQKRKLELPPIEEYSPRKGVTVRKLAEVYLDPGTFLKIALRKVRDDIVKGKVPTTEDKYVGIEIEFGSKTDRETLCDMIFDAGIGKHIKVGNDASIGRATTGEASKLLQTYPNAHEICILAKESEFELVITKLCEVLSRADCGVDKTCGLHVHLDMRHRDFKKAFHNLVSTQQFLYAMLPKNRRESTYSHPVKGKEYRKLESRYFGINTQAMDEHGTIELRMHCGTTQASKINNWIKLLIAIVEAPKIEADPVTVEHLQTQTGISDEILNYVKSRIAKFADQHKGVTKYSAEEPGTMPTIVVPDGAPQDTSVPEQSEVA